MLLRARVLAPSSHQLSPILSDRMATFLIQKPPGVSCAWNPAPSASTRHHRRQHATCKGSLNQDPNLHGIPDLETNTDTAQQPGRSAATNTSASTSPTSPHSQAVADHSPPAPPRQRLRAISSPYHPVDASHYDLNLTHYKIPLLRFLSPPVVVGLGLAFVVGANAAEGGFSLSVTFEAAVPVLLCWFILLQVLPTVFKEFAVHYLETHEFVGDDKNKQP